MKKGIIRKGLVLSIIVLFITVGVQPVFSGESITTTLDKNENNDYKSLMIQAIKNGVISNNNWTEQDKILASDGAAYDEFGTSVSIDGDYAIIGTPHDDDYGHNSGSTYIFIRSGTVWTEQAKLLASDGTDGDGFGRSVSIDGDTAIISAPRDDDNGSAYIFTRSGTTWIQQAKLLASNGTEHDAFGGSVSIDGVYAIIGAYGDDDNGYNSGSSYIFTHSGTVWTEQAKLLASDGEEWDNFGRSVSIDGDTALIGAYSINGNFSDSAYIFTRSGTVWTEQAKLLPSDGTDGGGFGHSVSIDGDCAIIGEPWDDDNGFSSGSAYIFSRSGTVWTEQAKLLASDGAGNGEFGRSVSIDGDTALIGAKGDDDNGGNSGSAYIFTHSGTVWTEQAKLLASDGAASDEFGWSVSIDGDYVLVGAHKDDNHGYWYSSGSAYIFTSENQPPDAPIIIGPNGGKPNIAYVFTFRSVDPDGDDVRFIIDWGDDTNDTTDYILSGKNRIVSHFWIEKGNYTIKAKALDTYGAESDWSEFEVTMSKNKATSNVLLLRFLERFPILQRFLQSLRLQ